MKKLGKFLRSRFVLGAACILLEFAVLVALFWLLYAYFMPITVLAWVIHVVALLALFNEDDIPEFKLLYLTILLMVPVLGTFVVLILRSNTASKKDYQRYEQSMREVLPRLPRETQPEQLKTQSPEAWLQANYLQDATGYPCFAHTRTEYFPSGEDFHRALAEDLEGATQFIFLEYFIVQEGQMWDSVHDILRRKVRQGVKVYMMYDDFGCMTTLPERYYAQLCNEGIHCVPANKFKPIISHIHNNRDHRKIAVIDGRVGYTGGVNLADEYINAITRFGHWKDTAVRLEGSGVWNLTALFVAQWNTQTDDRIAVREVLTPPEEKRDGRGYVMPFGDGPKPIYTDTIGKNVYLNMINAAKDYLYIMTPYLICDRELLNALRLAARKGVDVRLITPHIPDKKIVFLLTRSNYRTLMADGVRIYEYTPGFVHAKNFLCDDVFAVCGTINLDYRSLVHHFECGVWMYDTDCIMDMKRDFLETLALSREVTEKSPRISAWQQLLAGVLKILFPLL